MIITQYNWLTTMVNILENLPKDCVVAEPGRGWFIYPNVTARRVPLHALKTNPKIYATICGGGGQFIVKKSYIIEMIDSGIPPYNELLYMQSEDIDFALKVYLRGYKSVCTNKRITGHVKRLGELNSFRIYEMYKNRIIVLITNFSFKHIMKYLPYRIILSQ